MQSSAFNHEKISPTAKLVAHWRRSSDIPFSQKVASLFETEATYRGLFKDLLTDWPQEDLLPPLLECRYKCIWRFIENSPIKQVLEFASGVALRGLAMTADAALTYVETDLPGLMQEKTKLVRALMDDCAIKLRENLFFCDANILDAEQIEAALKHLDTNQPVIVVHEGLFSYLSMTEKALAAKNIHSILTRFGGVWITPDYFSPSHPITAFAPRHFEKLDAVIKKTTKHNFKQNLFESDEDAITFFEELGFEAKWQSQLSEDVVISSLAHNSNADKIKAVLKSLRLWMLTVRRDS